MITASNAISASSTSGVTQAAVVAREAQPTERIAEAPKAPFISPRVRVDVDLDRAILEIRDSDTGEVVDTFPSQQQLAAFERADAADRAASRAPEQQSDAPQAQEAPQQAAPAPQQQAPAPQPQQAAVQATDILA